MDIYVSHVRRKQIPAYVFPDGHKRPRQSRNTTQHTPEKDAKGCSSPEEKHSKRKQENETVDVQSDKLGKRASLSPQIIGSVSPASVSSWSGGSSQIIIRQESLEEVKTAGLQNRRSDEKSTGDIVEQKPCLPE